jgi:hypothetical protein
MTLPEGQESAAWAVRKLLRAARAGTLATTTAGQPFASLITPACAPDGALLMLLSELSEHTRHLRADPRCAVMVAGVAAEANPQTAPRVTVTGVAEAAPDPALKARWLAVHPYAALYADFGDFSLWRMAPTGALFVGGFGRARRLRAADLAPDPAAVAAVAGAAEAIIAHCTDAHADGMGRLADPEDPEGWRIVAVDTDGCDIARGERVVRVHWGEPVTDADAVRKEMIRLARAGH